MIVFLALNGGAVLAAFLVALALGFGGRTSRLILGTLAGYLVIVHSMVLAAGLAGHLSVAGLATLVGVIIAGALWLFRHTRHGDATDGGDSVTAQPRFTAAALFAPLAAIASGVVWAWPHLFQPTRLWVWDDYTYHMVYPALWLHEHAIAATTPAQAFTMQAWYPLSGSLVAAWFMAPFHGSRGEALAWVGLTGILYAGIVAVGAAELLTRLGCRRGAWAVPVVLFATSQRIEVMASSFSDADLAVAAALFAAFVFAVPRGNAERRGDVAVDALYAGLLSGLALGVKVNAAPQALIILLMTALRAGAPAAAPDGRLRAAVRTGLLFAAAWTATAGYWYVRNIVHTGNPVYPAAFLRWPGATFPETTLLEYGRRYGWPRAVADALVVYARWPLLHAMLAVVGLVGLAGWLTVRRQSLSRSRRYFAGGTLVIAGAIVLLLPAAPYSAGNAMTFRSGFVHWDSMRYVALLPILGWGALGFLVDGGAGARAWRTWAAVVIVSAALLTSRGPLGSGAVLVAMALCAGLLTRAQRHVDGWELRTVRRKAVAAAAVALVIVGVVFRAHGAKAVATKEAFYGEPLFGAAAAVLDRQPAGTRVAVFGDQWIYPAFGDRDHLRPVRLDRDGHIATAPIADGMTPGNVTIDPATFRANLRASGVDVVVLVHQPHPGRSADLPTQHAALEVAGGARLIHRDRAVAIWKLDP